MRFRAGRIALLVFQAVWLNALLPGHTRGVVTLPGAADGGSCRPTAAAVPDCCDGGDLDRNHGPSKNAPADPRRVSRCAVCFFAARLTLPPAIDLVPGPSERLSLLPPVAPAICFSSPRPLPFDARGPPAAA